MKLLNQYSTFLREKWNAYKEKRRSKCQFPYGHDYEREHPYTFMRGTGKFIKGEEIMEEVRNEWHKCKRCGDQFYSW